MEGRLTLDGQDFRDMLNAGTSWLEAIVPQINALNVYPVPDGDCGTNMLLTMRASLAEASKYSDGGVCAIAGAIARGALMGARGNSGVILSQIWRGLANQLKDKNIINAKDFADALTEASNVAYGALSNPQEGTILTVIRDAAAAACQEASSDSASLISVVEAAVSSAQASVINTPNLLPVLKDAGVVDAGGHGLYTFLEGALLYLKGETDHRTPRLLSENMPLAINSTDVFQDESHYGFCTQFMVKGEGLDLEKLRTAIQNMGESLIVVGDASTVRVHIHTQEPDTVIRSTNSFGEVFDININNMDEQHQEFLVMNRDKISQLSTAIIAVVNGDGMIKTFFDLGVTAIVPGGQSMNPSTMDILRTVEEVPAKNIILLPNNKNVIPTASLVQSLTKKNIQVIPTQSIPQGVSALVAFLAEADFETNATEMVEAIASVSTLEITRATRATKLNDLNIQEGQFIGLIDGDLVATGSTAEEVIVRLLTQTKAGQTSIITLYFGKDSNEAEADQISNKIKELYPGLSVGLVNGGQPNYNYIISIE